MLYWILVVAGAVFLLWMADKFGLGEGGEFLFSMILFGGAAWLAEKLNVGFIGVVILVGAVCLYLRHREKKAERLAQAEFRKQVTGLDDKQRAEISKLLAENYRKAGFKEFARRLRER